MKNFLGIDFGTTKTLAARWDERTKQALTIRLGRGGDAIPTTIHVDKNGEFSFGEDADDLRATDYAGWKGRIKRDLGRGTSVVLNGQSYRVADLIARFLAYVLRRVEEESFLVKVDQSYHGKVDHAVVTVPALYGPAERDELKQAIKQAGFTSFELLEEPVAAGCAFLAEKVGTELGSHILVFDWGGGTLDLALVEHRDNQFYLKPEWISGDKNLGGEDIDDSVVEGVDDTLTASIGSIDSQSDQNRLHIRRYLKEGKEQLSRRTKHKFRLPYEQGVREFEWSREEFEHYTASTINQAIACLQGHLERIRNSSVDVEHILLVGGASEIPAVKRRIEEELGLKAIRWEKSQIAVALGAAIRAARTGAAELADSRPKKKYERQKPPSVSAAFAKEYIGGDSQGNPNFVGKGPRTSPQNPSTSGECAFHIDVGVYQGNCTNLSLGDPVTAKLKLMIYCSTGANFIGNILLSGDLEGGSRFEGDFIFPEITFETRSSNNSFALEWKGTLAGDRIVGTYRSKEANWVTRMLGFDKQQGVWECVKIDEPLGLDKNAQFPTLPKNSGSSEDKLSLLLRPSGYGKFFGILSKDLLESNPFSIVDNIVECYWELVMTNKTKAPLKNVKIVISNPCSGETQAHIPIIGELTKEETLNYQLNWHFTPGNLIDISWIQKNSQPKLVYEVNSTDCRASRGQQLPIICTWKSGFFSGKVLNLRNIGEAKIDNLLVRTSTGSFNLCTFDPGAEIAIGWAEFSDSRNLKDDERIEFIAPGYLTDVGIITS